MSLQKLLTIRGLKVNKKLTHNNKENILKINKFLQKYQVLKNQKLDDEFICQYLLEKQQLDIDRLILKGLFNIKIEPRSKNNPINLKNDYEKLQAYLPLLKPYHIWKSYESIDDFIERLINESEKLPITEKKSSLLHNMVRLYDFWDIFSFLMLKIYLSMLIIIPTLSIINRGFDVNNLQFHITMITLFMIKVSPSVALMALSVVGIDFKSPMTYFRNKYKLNIDFDNKKYSNCDRYEIFNKQNLTKVYQTYFEQGFVGEALDNMVKHHYPEQYIDTYFTKHQHYHQVLDDAQFPYLIRDNNPAQYIEYSDKNEKLIQEINNIYEENQHLLYAWRGYFYYGDVEKELQSIKDELSNIVAKNYL